MTMQDVIDVQTTKSSAAPVCKKSAPISFTPTRAVSKPPNVVVTVIANFSVTPASKRNSPKTTRENPRLAISTPSVFVDADVPSVSNWKWGSKTIYDIVAGTSIVLPTTSTWTPKPTAVSFREPSPLKKSESRKRNANENVDVKEVLPPNGVLLPVFKPCEPMRWRRRRRRRET